ncbi:sperm-associated antigen 16 protein-like isoform X1 [Mizuhopecten yessoensis]|uniref:Sperm-associated antigen 16 protein n=1 Tax=Mizuhopecten yessoensis TaxID=6573 RepID=A0A210PSZ8_MIZYE|nr:sperm-associated antigen 16 protein-like isoform X1 [Mizuhopecten yessoensis]OWF39576.1 Sperm-associated antigen 16 protein [Mizuhopecten yessoensis]
MASNGETEKYYLEKEKIAVDSDDEYTYEEVPVDEDFLAADLHEDLDLAVQTIQDVEEDKQAGIKKDSAPRASVTKREEVVDDYVRNFLVRMGMNRTLDSFQTEWYELQQRGLLHEEDVGVVPDIYLRNQDLDNEVKFLKQEVTKYREAAMKAKETYVKLRKERDYHRMHHKRVVQEKNKLISDVKRLKRHYAQYEPTLQQLKKKYEVAMKEKMLSKLEKDRAVGQVTGLQSTLKSMESFKGGSAKQSNGKMGSGERRNWHVDAEGRGPTQKALAQEHSRTSLPDVQNLPEDFKRHPEDSEFPADTGVNPFLAQIKAPTGHLSRAGGFRLSNTFQAHSHPISDVALHPRKQILATSSDDHTWKMWAVPSGDIIMTGEGHTDWVSGCDFHPSGSKLATSSGDSTVKIWDFSKAECVHTFTDHTHAVWGCSWHTCGDFLASCSMDNTSKVWDLNSLRCRFTMRGHADSVNSIEFLPYSNTLLTCSADKTISLWDARTGLCAQTFYGHMHSVNYASFNLRGDTVGSCDSYGIVKLWDIRAVAPMVSFDTGPHPANRVSFDPSGSVMAVASNDSTVKMYEISNGRVSPLIGHEDAVQCLIFDRSGEYMVSGGSDCTVRIWS